MNDSLQQSVADSAKLALPTINQLDDTSYIIVFVIAGLWLLGITIFLIKLIRKYTMSDAWTQANPNPYQGETMALPRGVMRGILTISLLFIVILMEVVNLRMHGLEDKIDKLLVAFQMMIAFYFGSKVMHHVTKADERKSREISKAAAAKPGKSTTADFDEEGSVG